ncbi:hypothetical protein [Salinimicrobium terrae]|uniref:hypothetical protein n=1 Tax=Salinimicrobium terrae TaxID=470866 RepID=UPI000688E67B|nr:hypothetical protein [Salinimicrobium terrae]
MKNLKISYTLLLLFLTSGIYSCSTETSPENSCYSTQDPPRNDTMVSIDQGIWGDIWFWKGNFMPVGRGEICQVQRTVYIYELTTREEAEQEGYSPFFSSVYTDLVTTTESNAEGFFQVILEPGTYSLFIREGDNYYSNSYGPGGEIFPVTVTAGEVSEVLVNITTEAVF